MSIEFSAPAIETLTLPALRPVDYFTEPMVESVNAQFERGELPVLPNNFKVVIDRRLPGQENNYLSPEEYAGYASRREIAVAESGTRLHMHDRGHVLVDMLLLSHLSVADLVQSAAINAVRIGKCKAFIAFDTFGDNMGILYEFRRYADIPDPTFGLEVIKGVSESLGALVKLGLEHRDEQRALFEAVWHDLNLDGHILNVHQSTTGV